MQTCAPVHAHADLHTYTHAHAHTLTCTPAHTRTTCRDKQALKARIKSLEEEKERLSEKVERAKSQVWPFAGHHCAHVWFRSKTVCPRTVQIRRHCANIWFRSEDSVPTYGSDQETVCPRMVQIRRQCAHVWFRLEDIVQ